MEAQYFNTNKIYKNYCDVQANFHEINLSLSCQRDHFSDIVISNLMAGYAYLNGLIAQGKPKDAFKSEILLELNNIILLGTNERERAQYIGHINRTRDKFFEHYKYLKKWCKKHEKKNDDPYKVAAGIIVRILAQPQLFSEGNHRTSMMAANAYLISRGENPFILTPENAREFFEVASRVKFPPEDIKSKFSKAVGWHEELNQMKDFLRANVLPFLTTSLPEGHRVQHEEGINPWQQPLLEAIPT